MATDNRIDAFMRYYDYTGISTRTPGWVRQDPYRAYYKWFARVNQCPAGCNTFNLEIVALGFDHARDTMGDYGTTIVVLSHEGAIIERWDFDADHTGYHNSIAVGDFDRGDDDLEILAFIGRNLHLLNPGAEDTASGIVPEFWQA